MNEAAINNELMTLANFFGAIASTPGLPEPTLDKANKQLKRLLDALDKGVNHLIEASSALILTS